MIIWLAPMDGVTDYPYRKIVKEIFQYYNNTKDILRTWTEFMSADGYMINPSRLVKHLINDSTEEHLIAQIYGWNIDTLVKTAQDIEKKYPWFHGIELNIWCPSPKVLACGAGSAMMKDKKKTLEYIKIISENISLPFSIKTRSWLNQADEQAQFEFIVEASNYCNMIAIHGRTYNQSHHGDVNRDFIYNSKKSCNKNCIIIGNGWISSYEDIHRHTNNIDGIMIWQSAIWNPWIFTPYKPWQEDIKKRSIRHLLTMATYEIYMNHKRTEYPEISDQIAINRQHLHIQKKYNPETDDFLDIPSIDFHDYIFPMPNDNLINSMIIDLHQHLISWKDNQFIYQEYNSDINTLHCWIDFRKYLFWYIKGIKNNKEIKQQIISTKNIREILFIIEKNL